MKDDPDVGKLLEMLRCLTWRQLDDDGPFVRWLLSDDMRQTTRDLLRDCDVKEIVAKSLTDEPRRDDPDR